jgi:hypothetical protein
MPTTDLRGYPYPDIDEAPAGPYAIEQLAEAVEADMELVDGRVEFLESITPLGHMGRTAGFQAVGTDVRVAMAAAQLLRGGMTFDDAADALVVPLTGYYFVSCHLYASGIAGRRYSGFVAKNGAIGYIGPKVAFWKEDGNDYYQSASSLVLLTAGDKLSLIVTGDGNVYGSTGYDGCFIEAEYRGPAS